MMSIFSVFLITLSATFAAKDYIYVDTATPAPLANQFCQQNYGTQLARIDNAADRDAAFAACIGTTFPLNQCLIDLTDSVEEGVFTHFDGTSQSYFDWKDGEPNNVGNEDCVELLTNGQFNDIPCTGSNSARAFLCTAPTQEPTQAPTTYFSNVCAIGCVQQGSSSTGGKLVQLDLETGAFIIERNTNFFIEAMAVDKTNLIVYAIPGNGNGNLYKYPIDLSSEELIGETGGTDPYGLDFNENDGYLYSVDGSAVDIYKINPATAERTKIGETAGTGLKTGLLITKDGTEFLIADWTNGKLYSNKFDNPTIGTTVDLELPLPPGQSRGPESLDYLNNDPTDNNLIMCWGLNAPLDCYIYNLDTKVLSGILTSSDLYIRGLEILPSCTPTPSNPPDPNTCTDNSVNNVFFVVDESGSILESTYVKAIDYAKELITTNINSNAIIGAQSFARSNQDIYQFSDDQSSRTPILTSLENVKNDYESSSTDLGNSVQLGINKYISSANILNIGDNIMILLTDGKTNCFSNDIGCIPDLCSSTLSTQLNANNIRVVVIGIGPSINRQQLLCIADAQDILEVDDFTDTSTVDAVTSILDSILCPGQSSAKIIKQVITKEINKENNKGYFIELTLNKTIIIASIGIALLFIAFYVVYKIGGVSSKNIKYSKVDVVGGCDASSATQTDV